MTPSWLRQNASRLAALSICGLLAGMSGLPTLSRSERAELARHFQFATSPLPEVQGPPGGASAVCTRASSG